MAYSWDDEHLDVVNPDFSLLMSDCPAELSLQSHGLMLDVRRSVQLPYSREGAASRRTPVPIARDVRVLRRVQSFQDPAVSSSLSSAGGSYPVLTRVRSFFDFSREDPQVLDFKASNVLSHSEKVCPGGDGGVGDDYNHKAAEEKVGSNETSAASDVKDTSVESKSFDDAEAYTIDNGDKKAMDAISSGLDKPATGTPGAGKVDVSETIKKIESALEDALNVGSLKIDVRERIKRIQSAFEGFIPWDSAIGRPKVELRDPKPVAKVEVEEVPESGVEKLKTSQSDDGIQIERERITKEMKEGGGLDDSKTGDEVRACTLGLECIDHDFPVELNQEQIIQDIKDSNPDVSYEVGEVQVDTTRDTAVENYSHSQNEDAADDSEMERIIKGMEDGGLCLVNNVREVAQSTESVKPVVPESGACSEDEPLDMEMEETDLSALDSMDEMDEIQAVMLDFEAVDPVLVVRDPLSELKHVEIHQDMSEEEPEECGRATQVEEEPEACGRATQVEEEPEACGRAIQVEEELEGCSGAAQAQVDSPCNVAASELITVQSDTLDELMQEMRVEDVKEETPEYSDESVIVESSRYTAVANVEDDASSELNQILEEIRSRQSSRLKLIANVDKFDGGMSWDPANGKSGNLQSDDKVNLVRETSLTTLTLNEVDDVRPSMPWNVVSEIHLDTQVAASNVVKQDRFTKEMNDNSSRKSNEFQLEAGRESVVSEKSTTDHTSGLPSPLSQLLDYRHGSAFTFLNVQDDFPEPSSSTVELPAVPNNLVGMFERASKEASAQKPQKVKAKIHTVNRLNVQELLRAEDVQMFDERDSIQLWNRVLQELTSRNLKHLLLTQGRLISAGLASDGSSAIVEIEFQYASDKHKAERSWRSICSAFQCVLSLPIELRISSMKNVFDEGLLPRNLIGMDDEERNLLIQYTSRLKQETEVACYSTDHSHAGSHSKRRRRRARRDWQPKEIVAQELEPQPRSETGSVPGLSQPTHRRNGSIARPIADWRNNGSMESSFSESVEQNSRSTEIGQSSMPIGSNGRRPRLRTMLDAEKSDTDDNQAATQSNPTRQKITEFRTDRGLPLDVFCFPCTQRIPLFRREPTRDMDQFQTGREGDLRSKRIDRRVNAQGQPFFLRMVPCKSVSTVRTSKARPHG
ncbi:hypothetical protein M758_4G080800 [Ceratodon purpureus]|nr:hypothetical protein M758_4G080800 [Ceratodon purpureus]